ncbi:MAG: V-type ATP synthase subunit I [Promethearchaeota archaeon]
MLTPAKMEICKITAYAGRKRKIIRALHKCGQIEVYDMEKKGGAQSKGGEEEKNIFLYLSQVNQLIDFLQPRRGNLELKVINEEEIESFFAECENFFSKFEPQVDKIRREIADHIQKIADLETRMETFSGLVDFDFDVSLIGPGEQFFCTVGQVASERLERLKFDLSELTNNNLLLLTSSTKKKMVTIVVGVHNQYQPALENVLIGFGFLEVRIPPDLQGKPKEILNKTQQLLVEHNERIRVLEEERAALATENASMLFALKEQLEIEHERIEIAKRFRESQTTIEIWGWVPTTEKEAVAETLKKVDQAAYIEFMQPDFPAQEYPSHLKNPKFINAYEPLVHSFGSPSYGKDWDPSFIMFFTFPIIFGIMFADIGHGFLLLLLGLLGMTMKEVVNPEGMVAELKDYLQKGGVVITCCGLASMFFGVAFGSIFGLHGHNNPFLVDVSTQHGVKASSGAIYSWFGVFPTLFIPEGELTPQFGNATGIFLLLELALLVGIMQISSGFILQAIMEIRHRNFAEALFGPICFLILYLSAAFLLFTYGANIMDWFGFMPKRFTIALVPFTWNAPESMALIVPGGFFIFAPGMLLPAIIALVYHVRKGMDVTSHFIDTVISLIGNTVSYARIFAINIVHGIISFVPFLIISNLIGGAIIPIVGQNAIFPLEHSTEQFGLIGLLIGTFIVLTLELIITFLQCLRLHWVEWFSKLHYRGEGQKFMPFKETRIFTTVQAVDT